MSQTELRKEWELRIAEYRASGLTQTKWCEENDLKIHQFHYWLRKIEKPQVSSPKWIPITMDEHVDDSKDSIQIRIGKASIEVKPGFDPSHLADVRVLLWEVRIYKFPYYIIKVISLLPIIFYIRSFA